MICVDLYLPVLDKTYDFNLDENAVIGVLIEEIAEVIAQKEQSTFAGEIRELMLCNQETGEIMAKNKCLSDCGVHTGSRILLV